MSTPSPPSELLLIQRRYNGYLYWNGTQWVLGLPEGVALTPSEQALVSKYNAIIVRFKGPISFMR
jgi:hypothetical protein